MTKPGATPEVTVIIPTYNYSSVLRYAIATVLWQSFQNFELIVVGDGCTDDSEDVVRSFGDERITWMNLPENSGAKYAGQNTALRVARGKYIAYLAHDDLWHREHLSLVLEAAKRDGADMAYTVALYVPPPGETRRMLSGVFAEGIFTPGHCLIHSTIIHPKKLIEELGEWPDHKSNQLPPDYIFFNRIADAGKKISYVPRLTTWKFNASSRPNCYREKRSDEQAHYYELLRTDPALAETELLEVARSAMIHGLEPLRMQKPGRDAPPGTYVHYLRQIRGLEEPEPMELLSIPDGEEPFRIAIAQEPPRQLAAGERIELEVQVQNNSEFRLSSDAPHPIHLCYHWRNADGAVADWDGARSQFLPPLQPQTRMHYFAAVIAPDEPGNYLLQFALVQENARWYHNAPEFELPMIEVVASKADEPAVAA